MMVMYWHRTCVPIVTAHAFVLVPHKYYIGTTLALHSYCSGASTVLGQRCTITHVGCGRKLNDGASAQRCEANTCGDATSVAPQAHEDMGKVCALSHIPCARACDTTEHTPSTAHRLHLHHRPDTSRVCQSVR